MATRPLTMQGRAEGSGPHPGSHAAPGGGQRVAFESAVLVHLDAAYTLARYLTRRGDAAEDIVQEALLRAYRGFGSYRGGNVRAWLLAIVRNCFLTWNARSRNDLADRPFDGERGASGELDELGKEHGTPESILIQHEENSAIRAAVEQLPHLFREVLVLRDIEDMPYREIAEVTGVPIGTVMSRLARARKMFAAAWKGPEMKPAEEMQR
ncbi:MAG: sigma-70 family RNA polymerase sigma factor [Rhodomicrobium sp.]